MSVVASTTDLINKNNDHHELDGVKVLHEDVDKKIKNESPDGLSRLLVRLQNGTSMMLRKNDGVKKFLTYLILNGLLIGYFAWATYYFIKFSGDTLEGTTCSGYGLLMILFILIYFGVIYYMIIKPYVIRVLLSFGSKHSKSLSKILTNKWVKAVFYGLVFVAVIAYLIVDTAGDRQRLMPLSGLVIFLVLGWLFCKHPGHINWRPIIWGLILQFVFGLITIRWETGRNIFECVGNKTTTFLNYATDGAAFVYGDLLVYKEAVFAFQALSTIYFLGFMINILYHYEIMQKVVVTIGEFLKSVLGTTICESVNSASNIFLGMSEAPLLLKPYLEDLTASEIHSIMASGFATVSGTVLAAYISFGANASHLITASVMSAPAALCYSKLVYPEIEETKATKESIQLLKSEYTSALDAASKGASMALELVLGITANLIAFISLVYFVNGVLSWMGALVGYDGADAWSIETVLAYVFMPVSYIMGVPWKECDSVGKLIGIKTAVNEFAAFKEMGKMTLKPRTKVIATYAICGFSNPGSIGIMISALTMLMPKKRDIVTSLVMRAFVQPNGGSTTSSLRQWRKKDFIEKQAPSETIQPPTNEHPSHIARVAPHTYYPPPPEDPCNYQHQFNEYGATYKPPVPVKYSEIVENQQPQTIDHLAPSIQKQKEKDYVDLCNVPSNHLQMKQSAYPEPISLSHQYIQKDSQMYPFVQNKYVQKEPYQQFLSKYNMQNQFHPSYNSQPNDFLAHLNKINPRMAQSIINDAHLRDTQIPMYHHNSPPFSQPQRMYHTPPQKNYGAAYNYQPQYNYNRVHQYHHNSSKYAPDQQRYYNDVNYAPFPPNYPQVEYAQHYQHRRQYPQDYYVHYKNSYSSEENQNSAESVATRKSSLKQYLENWVDEDLTGANSADKTVADAPDLPLYVLDSTDIPNDNLPHFLHLQQVEKLPDNIKGYYQEEGSKDDAEELAVPEIFERECSIVATVEKSDQPPAAAAENLEDKVVQIHITENAETPHEGVIKMCKDNVVSDVAKVDSPPSLKNMPEINEENQSAINNKVIEEEKEEQEKEEEEQEKVEEEQEKVEEEQEKVEEEQEKQEEKEEEEEAVGAPSCDKIDLGDTSKDYDKTEVIECLESILEEITAKERATPPAKKRKLPNKPKKRKKRKIAEAGAPELVVEPPPPPDEENANEEMPVLEREVLDETETNVVYQVDDSNVVLQIGDELLEIIVSVQNDKKIITVKTFSDAVIMDEPTPPPLQQPPTPCSPIEEPPALEPIEEIMCVSNEEIVSSSTAEEVAPVQQPCLEPEPVKTKAALKMHEPPPKAPEPKPKPKKKREVTKPKPKEPRKVPDKIAKAKRKDAKRDRIRKNNVDMLYKMSIVPSGVLNKAKAEEGEKVNVQEHNITSSSEASDPRKHVDKILQQINDDWEDDFDTVKQEDTGKRRLSLQEYNDRKRIQEQEKTKPLEYDKVDLTSNLLQDVAKRREPELRTYSRDKKEEPLSSRIELQLPNQRRIPNYNQEYLRNALMNDLHTVNQITATLMKENQELMQRFLEQQRLSASELKKVKQIIRYKRLVHHLTNMKPKEIPPPDTKVTERRKKKRFRFLYTDSEPEPHEPPNDYSVHQGNSQGQLTLVFKRSFKTDPKMQPFVKLERIRSLDWLASNLQ
ncbi:hypothetical protein FQR65_LT10780 [Abscondita terminalis]|nr:hypothetical protein FQR65_LT10780 [Abscondita terminalis]